MKLPFLGELIQVSLASWALAAASPLGERACHGTWVVGQSISTTSGKVIGHAAPLAPEVSEYLGIPYAQSPTGLLRFEPPNPFNGSHYINATEFGPACMQIGGPDGQPQSEDCLTLNVWTKPQGGPRQKAVLVWVHGGAYVLGSSRAPIYTGQFFADQEDVVLVSINYRLNVFGFPGNPETTANLGLLDMRQAMLWIRDNIAKFGGDVNRVTIFGQSAGAGMVDFYSYAYPEDPIATGFILQSANVDGFPALASNNTAYRWSRLVRAVGCEQSSGNFSSTTECMKSKTSEELVGGFTPEDTEIGAVPAFGPVADDVLVFADYSSRRSASGGYLIGNNHNEAGLFQLFQPNQTDEYWQDFNDRLYTCAGADRLARSIKEGNPSWRYRYFGNFSNLAVSTDPPSGAYHGAELQPLFDTMPTPSSAEQVAVGDYLRGAWAAFAKSPQRGLLAYAEGWPRYGPTQATLVQLAFDNGDGANVTLGNAYDDRCQSF